MVKQYRFFGSKGLSSRWIDHPRFAEDLRESFVVAQISEILERARFCLETQL
jgi:hypothetical protein